MIRLSPFHEEDFDLLISWVKDEYLLLTIAGHEFSFPLTADQLRAYLDKKDSYAFNITYDPGGRKIGHAQLARIEDDRFIVDKLIVGDESLRGKGLGKAVIRELLDRAFGALEAGTVELNVFDWNISGIRCYQACGFVLNEGKKTFKKGDQNWTAFNMKITREEWQATKYGGNLK